MQIFGNVTATDAVIWSPASTTRGTLSILSSCIITLLLCVWTAVHLNIPGKPNPIYRRGVTKALLKWREWELVDGFSPYSLTIRKACWLILGVLAPELVVFTAWYQHVKAKQTVIQVSKAFGKLHEAPPWYKKFFGKFSSLKSQHRPKAPDTESHGMSIIDNSVPVLPVGIDSEPCAKQVHRTNADATPADGVTPSIHDERLPDVEVVLPEWTMDLGFYANMGGIAFDATRLGKGILSRGFRDHVRCVLTPRGVATLVKLKPDLLADITSSHIQDKSKSNGLGKLLVCLQAFWFMAQCIARLAQSLPISLLELNTLLHCVCAFTTYGLWWYKPLDVVEPTFLQGDSAREVLAWMLMCNHSSSFGWSDNQLCSGNVDGWCISAEEVDFSSTSSQRPQNSSSSSSGGSMEDSLPRTELEDAVRKQDDDLLHEPEEDIPHQPQKNLILQTGEQLLDTGLYFVPENFPGREFTSIELQPADVARWKLAAPLFKTPASKKIFENKFYHDSWNTPLIYREQRQLNWRWPGKKDSGRTTAWIIFVMTGIIYGGLHLLAWNALFQSRTEQLLWQISASFVAGIGLLYAILRLASRYCQYRCYIFWRKCVTDPEELRRGGPVTIDRDRPLPFFVIQAKHFAWFIYCRLHGIIAVLLFTPYFVARAYLVLESFRNLFHAPPALFKQPSFAQYFPHFGLG